MVTRSCWGSEWSAVRPPCGPTDRGSVRKTTRWAAVLVVTVAVLTACTSNSADPGTTSTSPTPTSGAAPSSVSASSTPATSPASSFVKPTPSVAEPTNPNPWPDDLTPEQVADAQAAIEAYRGFWTTVDLAIAQPGQDWTEQIALVATGPTKASLLENLAGLTDRGRHATGTTGVAPEVTEVQPGLVVIADCVDKTSTDLLNLAGESVKAPDAAGTYFRHLSNVQMIETSAGRWVVALTTDDWSMTC